MSAHDVEKGSSSSSSDVVLPSLAMEGEVDARGSVEVPSTLNPSTPQRSQSTSSIDKKDAEGDVTVSVEPVTLPEKSGNRVTRFLIHNFFSSYRKSFAVIFAVNLAVFIAQVVTARGDPPSTSVGSAASANLMVAILFRQENFVNILYEIFCAAPHSWPVSIRKRLAKVFHYGGCHSGCGVAAVVWYFLYTSLVTRDYVRDPRHADLLANMITSWILVSMFFFILGGAHPTFRRKNHDWFEALHRFSGWIALCTFWVHNIFSAHVTAREQNSTIGLVLVHSPNFWCINISTFCTLLSWSRLRLRTVYAEKLSDHATRLHFKYYAMQPFYGVKLSNRPLTEWHAFATIPDVDETGKINGFSVLVSNAGDWTKKQIMEPNAKLWIRGAPLHGLLYSSRLFRKIVVVATGSGIGPCLSLFFADYTPRRIFWSTPAPEKTYGKDVINAVLTADPDAVIWNTRVDGRPDMVLETYKLVKECGAEAVYIISNPKITQRVVYGMQTRGIPAYGAIFDS